MHRAALIAYVILPPSIVEAGNVTHVVENDEVDSAEVRVPEEMCGRASSIICRHPISRRPGGIRAMDEPEMECGFYVKGFRSSCMSNQVEITTCALHSVAVASVGT